MIPLVHKFQCTFLGLFRRHFHFHAYLLRDKTVGLGNINFTFFSYSGHINAFVSNIDGLDLPFVNSAYV